MRGTRARPITGVQQGTLGTRAGGVQVGEVLIKTAAPAVPVQLI